MPCTRYARSLRKNSWRSLQPTIYFFVALHIVAFVRVLMLKKNEAMKPKLNKLIQRAAVLLFAFVAVVAQAADKKPNILILWATTSAIGTSALITKA